jgi:hypothetical protein
MKARGISNSVRELGQSGVTELRAIQYQGGVQLDLTTSHIDDQLASTENGTYPRYVPPLPGFLIQNNRVAFAQKQQRGLLAFSSRNSNHFRANLAVQVLISVPSYPRLTLDFHTNKRIIDEVVSIFTIAYA